MIFEKSFEHRLLPIPFFLLTCTGAWCPSEFGPVKKVIYYTYSAVVGIIQFTFIGEVLAYVIDCIIQKRFEPWPIFILTTITNSFYKLISAVRKDWILTHIIEGFSERWRIPRDSEEEQVMKDSSRSSRTAYILYAVIFLSSALFKCAITIATSNEENRILPSEVYLPYDINNNSINYWLTFFEQTCSAYFLCALIMSTDILLSAIMLQISLQLKLIKHRLIQYKGISANNYEEYPASVILQQERRMIRELVNDHRFVYNFSEDINNDFFGWILSLFLVGTPNLCINAYLTVFSKTIIEAFVAFVLAMVCFSQILLLCWCGNEVSISSVEITNAVYEMDWISLSNSIKKDLILINLRASRPIVFTIGSIVPLNIDSMLSVLRSSYSALNVLKQT